ncbi:MAG: phosphatase PAP2 family protein [Bdellovibrionales bacterium]|nr:phosphatase PAP2 family protein [Bdellovibrionales bacterium]
MALLKVFIIIIILIQNVFANETGKDYLKDVSSDLTSPFTTPAKWILIGGAVTTGMMYITRKDITYRKRDSYREAKPLGKVGFIGNYVGYGILNAAYSAYFLWDGMSHDNIKSMQAAEHMMRATTYTLGLTLALKYAVDEKRPGYPDDHHSFPSGHSSASFAFASVIAAQHGWVWGGLAHGLASFIAVSRSNDDFHYLHDITAGITIGATFAWGIYYNLEKGNPYWFSLIPVKKGAGLAMGLDF